MKARVLKGLGAGMLGQIISIVTRISLVPLFLLYWGSDQYAVWLLISAVVSYLTLVDFGGQLFIINKLTIHAAKEDWLGYQQTFQSILVLYVVVPLTVLILFFGLLYLGWAVVPNISAEASVTTIRLAAGVMAAQVLASLLQGILVGVYRTLNELPRSLMLTNGMLLAQLVFQVIALVAGGGFIGVALAAFIPVIGLSIYVAIDLPRRFSHIDFFSLSHVTLRIIPSLFAPSLYFFLIQFSYSLSMNGPILVMGYLSNATTLVLFHSARTMVNLIKQTVSLLSHTLAPEFTRLDATGKIEGVARVFGIVANSSLLVGGVFVVGLSWLGEDLFKLWLGTTVPYDPTLVYLLLSAALISIYIYSAINLIMAVNSHHTLSVVMLINSFAGLGAAYWLGLFVGAKGVVLGIALAELLILYSLVPRLLTRRFPEIGWRSFIARALPIIMFLVIGWVSPELSLLFILYWAWNVYGVLTRVAQATRNK